MAATSKSVIGSKPKVASLTPTRKKEYRITNRIQEGKKQIWAMVFNFIDPTYFDVFATVSSNRVTVYQCLTDGAIEVLHSFIDEDMGECFYTVSWVCILGSPFLVAGGVKGILRVMDYDREKITKSLVGHEDEINEIRTDPRRPSLVLSACKDKSVRLWNVQTGICIMIFAGADGHCNNVLSVDFHPSDIYRIATCGMDTTVMIWSIKEFWPYVEQSFTWAYFPSKFPTQRVQSPILIANVHTAFADCNRWLGNSVLSKGKNKMVLWEPKIEEQSPGKASVNILQKYPVPDCDIWFIKFSFDFEYKTTAVGNREGEIYLWDLKTSPPELIARLAHRQCRIAVRQTALSYDGSTILGCCDDGMIWRWDLITTS